MNIVPEAPRIVISAMGHFHPENIIENSFFDELGIDSDAAWITDRTGIAERRSILTKEDLRLLSHGDTTPQQLRAEGRVMRLDEMSHHAFTVCQHRHIDPSHLARQVEAVICGTSVGDYDIPANACAIASRTGMHQAVSFDVNSACSGFVVDLMVARSLLLAGVYRTMAIFNPERYTLRLNYRDRKSCILFGDGCSCAALEAKDRSESASGLELIDVLVMSEPAKYDVVKMEVGNCFDQDGNAVQKFAISQTVRCTQMLLDRNHITPQQLTYFIGHQANLRMVQSSAGRLGLEPHQHLYNVDQYGNQGAAGAPNVLSMNWERFKTGDLIAITVVGSGLTWGSALLRKI